VAFYARLGFKLDATYDNYRILSDGKGGEIHLTAAPKRWFVPHHNLFGIYIYSEDVDELAASLGDLPSGKPEEKSWGMYEFALSDPDGTLVRVGWPSAMKTPD
jgi:hypothetical protein